MSKKSLVKLARKTNPRIVSLILTLKERAHGESAPIWKDIAKCLEAPTRNYATVNLSKISRHTIENDVLLVPGKVLGAGFLNHSVTVVALNFSESAVTKISEAGGACLSIEEILESNPKGSGIRIFR